MIKKKLIYAILSLFYNTLTTILGAGRARAERTKVYPSTENCGEDEIEGGQVAVFSEFDVLEETDVGNLITANIWQRK